MPCRVPPLPHGPELLGCFISLGPGFVVLVSLVGAGGTRREHKQGGVSVCMKLEFGHSNAAIINQLRAHAPTDAKL